jgi:lipopolysaccharide transport system ATP-binding protein
VLRGRVSSLLEVGTGFHSELTGRENILLNGALLGMTRRETRAKFDAIVEFAGLERFLDTPVKFYSSGMYVRLGFSIAAHLEPDVLIVDEVLAVGDADFQRRSLGKMEEVTREHGRTVLFVSHAMSAVQSLCTRAIVLDAGRLALDGSPREAVQRYLGSADRAVVELAPPGSAKGKKLWFTRVSFGDTAGGSRADFDAGERVRIELGLEVAEAMRDVQLAVELWNDEGECVLSSSNFDEDPSVRSSVLEPGRYVAACEVETDLLRRGGYHVTIASSIPGVEVLDQREYVAHFSIIGEPEEIRRLGQTRRGAVYRRFRWETRAAEREAARAD